MKFSKTYWDLNYSEPQSMDGIGNAKEHCRYIKSSFKLEEIDISSIIDFGFGYGYLFLELLKTFIPFKAYGMEPSEYAYRKAMRKKFHIVESMELELSSETIEEWAKKMGKNDHVYDLGVCTSVFQYLSQKELEFVVPIMARHCKYLYLTVPTDIELKRQREEIEFDDQYALRRTQKFYLNILSPHFAFVGNKVLESKYHFNKENSFFTDLLFRF